MKGMKERREIGEKEGERGERGRELLTPALSLPALPGACMHD